jgi:hypothetical protein
MKKHDILRLNNSAEAIKLSAIENDLRGNGELLLIQKPQDLFDFEMNTNREFN